MPRPVRAYAAAIIAALAISAADATPAGATPVQVITVQNDAGVPAAILGEVEDAIVWQSRQLRRWWHTPIVQFGPDGWPLQLVISATVDGGLPYHVPGPAIVVPTDDQARWWSSGMSHEVMETLVDPSTTGQLGGTLEEVCDPVDGIIYDAPNGTALSDFVTPRWFGFGGGRLDELELLHHPLQASASGYVLG